MVGVFRQLLIIETNSFSLMIKGSETNGVTYFWSFCHSCEDNYGISREMSVVHAVYTRASQSVVIKCQNMENLPAQLWVHTSNMRRSCDPVLSHYIAVMERKVPNRKY